MTGPPTGQGSRRYAIWRVDGTGERRHVGYVSAETEAEALRKYRHTTVAGRGKVFVAREVHTRWRKA